MSSRGQHEPHNLCRDVKSPFIPNTCPLRPGVAMSNGPIIPHDLAARRIEDALRLRVGRGKRYSFNGLSDATGIPPRTLESYVQGATPGLSALLSLFAVLGPGFTSDVLSACGQSASTCDNDAPEYMQTMAASGSLVAQLADALADGHVDHREAAQLRSHAAALIEMLEPMARLK